MQRDLNTSVFLALNDTTYEDWRTYTPGPELRDIVQLSLGRNWNIRQSGYWTYCSPDGFQFLSHGWKIHLSGRADTASTILSRTASIIARHEIAFKFCSDLRVVRLSMLKQSPRVNCAKFVTIYPTDTAACSDLMEDLRLATADLDGPRLLTDRPYKDSRIVHYRYGGHAACEYVNSYGAKIPYYTSDTGERLRDERVPQFLLPQGITDPFRPPTIPLRASLPGMILNDRYKVIKSRRFSTYGGVYEATDLTSSERVIVREARPYLSKESDPLSPINILTKEASILRRLSDTPFAPRFVDLFQQGGHTFLVEEKLTAETLWGVAMNIVFSECRTSGQLFIALRKLFASVVEGLEAVHARHIILRDMTRTNVLFTPADRQVRFIDFEFAFQTNVDVAYVDGWTSGYASPEQIASQRPTAEQDYYALGALMLDAIAFTAPGLTLNRHGVMAGFLQVLLDLGLPTDFYDCVETLTAADSSRRATPQQTIQRLANATAEIPDQVCLRRPGEPRPSFPPPTESEVQLIDDTRNEIIRFLTREITLERNDRLWPSSYNLYLTNPVNYEYGATGPAWFLYIHEKIDPAVTAWILSRAHPSDCPPGLYVGLSGIALYLSRIGCLKEARDLMALCNDSDVLHETAGLYCGSAGIGLANLDLWHTTREERWLASAQLIGTELLRRRQTDASGLYWKQDDITPVGLAFGSAGIALFLAHLSLATRDDLFLEAAMSALDFDIAQGVTIEQGLLFYPQVGSSGGVPKSPHTRFGTAGVGSVAIRLYEISGEQRYLEKARICADTCSSRYSNKLWQDYGLAGLGEFLLDMYHSTNDDFYLRTAFHLAGGILPYRIITPNGVTFAGRYMERIGCDFGEGSSGIGYFFARLLDQSLTRPLFCDEHLMVSRRAPCEEIANA